MSARAPVGPIEADRDRLAFLQHAQRIKPDLLQQLYRLHVAERADGLALYEWSRSFGLYTPWTLRFARAVLAVWSEQRSPRMEWVRPMVVYRMPLPDPLTLTFAWEPDVTPDPATFIDRVTQEATAAARAHVRAVQAALAKSSYWKQQPPVRRGGKKRPGDSLRWLALYQVGRQSYQRIAETSLVESSSVRRAAKKAAERIGLPLRS